MCKALNKTRGLYGHWSEWQVDGSAASTPTALGAGGLPVSREELAWTTTELRNALRSIEWDLEDLEDTIYILFFISLHEIDPRFCILIDEALFS